MIFKIVDVWVKPEYVSEYIKLTEFKTKGARSHVGIKIFEIYQDQNCSNHFIHHEVFLDESSEQSYKMTDHYKIWRDTVDTMMISPRTHFYLNKVCP